MHNKIKDYLKIFLKRRNFILFFFLFIACSNLGEEVVISGDTIVAKVNDVEITVDKLRDEIIFLIMRFRITNKNSLTKEEKLLLKIKGLNQVIRNDLLIMEANSSGIFLTMDEYEMALGEVESGYKEDSFWAYLNVQDISPELWKRRLKNNLLINKLIDTKFKIKTSANETEARKYYEVHKERFEKGRMVHAYHIMVATEDEAKVVYGAIKSKNKSFSELAKMYSLSLEASIGGDLGYFEVGQMPEEFNVISGLKENQISEVIKTPYGYHIFKVVDIKAQKQLSFFESRDAIYDQFSRDEQSGIFEKWLIELKNNANIKINEDVLSKVIL